MKIKLLLMLLAAVSCTTRAGAATDGVRKGTLPNGITYYVCHNASPAGRADFFLVRGIGSVVENENERGLAHFLEHMCFNGTRNFPGNSVISYLESIGVKFGADLNAYTSADETVYNISRVPVARTSVIDSCLLIMHDWSCALTLSDAGIDAERGVIVNEWRQRNTAANRMLERAAPQLYPGSAYGNRLPIGLMSVVENFNPQTLRDFYRKWHRTDNEAIIVAGDIDPDDVVERIRKKFGSIPASENGDKPVFSVPDTPELTVIVETDPEQNVDMLQLHFKHSPVVAATAKDQWRADIVSELLTSMLAGRFDAVEADPGCPYHHLGVGDMKYFLSRPIKSLMLRGICLPGREAETLTTWYTEVSRALRHGFMPGELSLAKKELAEKLKARRSRVRSNTDVAKRLVRHYLDGGFLCSWASETDGMEALLPEISVDEVTAYLRSIVDPSGRNAVVLLYKPDDKQRTGKRELKKDLSEAFHAVNDMEFAQCEDFAISGLVLEHEPVPGSIESVDSLAQFAAESMLLSNGVRVYARRSNSHPGQIYVRGVSPGGLSMRYCDELIPSMKLINEAMAVSRFGQFSSADLRKLCTGMDIAVTTNVDITKETVEMSTSARDMRDAFRLLYLKLTDARPDTAAFLIMQRAQTASLARRYLNPTQAMGDSIHRNVYSHHPLGAKITADIAAAADYTEILDLYRDRFSDVSDFTFYVTGDYDPDSLRSCLESYVASLPAAGRMEKVRDIGYRFTPGTRELRFTAKMETPQAIVYTFYHGPAAYDVKTAVSATVLGQIVKSRLLADLRENRGWTYGITGHCSALPSMNDVDPSSFLFPVYIKTSPEHADEVAEAVSAVVEAIAANGPDGGELNKVKEFMLKSWTDNAADNAYWLSVLKVYNDSNLDMHEGFRKAVEALTPADISAFARGTVLKGDRIRLMMLPQ